MTHILPKPVRMKMIDMEKTTFHSLNFILFECKIKRTVIQRKFSEFDKAFVTFDEKGKKPLSINVSFLKDHSFLDKALSDFQKEESYSITVKEKVDIKYTHEKGFLNALSTLKQLILKERAAFSLPHVEIEDYPNVEVRSLSTTFAWYAGYSRIGFDSQLWNFEKWRDFVERCSDLKINQLNMCMYGYWPFPFDEFPETTLSNYPMKVWNHENETWIEIKYTHPNIVEEFLPDLIEYAHDRFMKIFAYIGLNSYNGGYSNVYRDRRAVPPDKKYYNNFDFLCLSNERNIDYLKKSIRRIVGIGFDGIIFEESEENYWYCSCSKCAEKYLSKTSRPSDAKHMANYELLKTLHRVIRDANPHCEVGLRAWREEPFEKEPSYLEKAKNSIPEDVFLYWAPGPYNPESEFEKWVAIFGPHRICARDQEANAYSASMGRLFYMFRSNIPRPDKEHLYWSLEKDVDQYLGAVKNKCRGINGYLFEYYAYFLHLFAAAQYGWNASVDKEEFYSSALQTVFDEKLASDILYVYKHLKLIHETQLPICTLFFPFMRHKYEAEDSPLLKNIQKENRKLMEIIGSILESLINDPSLKHYVLHFHKLKNMVMRNELIIEMCLKTIGYQTVKSEEEKKEILHELYKLNEKDFQLIQSMYFDVNPHEKSGVKVCGFPYHELKRTISNLLKPEKADQQTIYLGTETIGWIWI